MSLCGQFSLTKTAGVSNDELRAAAHLSFKNMMGFSEGKLSINASLVENTEIFDRESYHKIKTTGGDYSVANFFAGKPPEETIEAWLANLITNAVPIKIRVAEIYHLFDDEPELRTKIKSAMPSFYNGTSALDTVSFSLINSNF